MNELGLSINGTLYSGWKNVRLMRSLEQLAPTFNVSYTERVSEHLPPLPINEGDSVSVKIDSKPIVPYGYVDDIDRGYTKDDQTAEISGRASTGDLVDCTAIYKTGQWRNASLETIAKDLCAPFGVSVEAVSSVGKAFRRFSLQDGETVHEALSRACRMRGLLQLTSAEGKLRLARAGTRQVRTVLEYGKNVKEANLHGSWKDRFSQYVIKAQAAGDDLFFGQDAVTIKRTADDDNISRYRPTIIQAENEDSGKELQERANWERNIRAGKGRRYTCTVQGWYDGDGDLWEPNTLVPVLDHKLRLRDTLLLVTVNLQRTMTETTAQLELCRKEAFDVQPYAAPKPAEGDGFLSLISKVPKK